MIGTCIAIFKRQSRSIFLFGVLLLLLGFISCSWPYGLSALIIILLPFIIGISFIVWGIALSGNSSNPLENNSKQSRYKYWLYSASFFCTASMLVAIFGRFIHELDVSRNHEFLRKVIFPTTWYLVLIGILQIILYYILCKLKEHREKNQLSKE